MQAPDLIPEMGGGMGADCAFGTLEDFMDDDFHQATRGDPLLSSSHGQGQRLPAFSAEAQAQHQGDLSQDRYQPSEEDESLSPESLDRMELSA